MLSVASRLCFYKNIARPLLRNFADIFTNIKLIFSGDFPHLHKYKANFLWRFPTNLRDLIVCEANYSYQFCYLIKKCQDDAQEEAWRKNQQYVLHIFISIVHFLMSVDKWWFKVRNLLIYLSIHVYFQVRICR